MSARRRTLVLTLGAAAGAVGFAAMRHTRWEMGRKVPGGILIRDPARYDALTHRLLLGSLFGRIAADVAAVTPDGARILEVGCGPGHLSLVLAGTYGLDVTGIDLDPVMIERAQSNAGSRTHRDRTRPAA
jgi:2-polyprenyl-3-methyl-5-hydroxy-6-metoxy-1,4-benzoquinol methylase